MVRQYPYPGKFEGELIYAPYLYQFAGYGSGDDFCGNVSEIGWCATLLEAPLVDDDEVKAYNEKNPDLALNDEEIQHLRNLAGVIIEENDQGCVYIHEAESREELMQMWEEFREAERQAYEGVEEEDGE